MTRVLLIAEAGVNHNGDPRIAHDLIDAAASAGADAVKFQSFRAEALAAPAAKLAPYQRATGSGANQLELLRALEIDDATHFELRDHCRDRGVEFLSTPFDVERLRFLVDEVGLERIKIASGDITNGPLLLAAGRSRLPILLSTGMAAMEEIREALGVLAFASIASDAPAARAELSAALADPGGAAEVRSRVTLLQCTSQYPAPEETANLRAMDTLRTEFDVPVGFSDHTAGTVAAIAAAALGARVIEKHFTLDKSLPGPDQAASLEPEELREIFAAIRTVQSAMGAGVKEAQPGELENRAVVRRSLVARRPITAGQAFTEEDLAAQRPEGGMSPMSIWDLVGRPASRSYNKGDFVNE